MSQFKFIIPAKVTDDGKFDTSDLLKKEEFNTFKNSEFNEVKEDLQTLKNRPNSEVNTSNLVSSELFNEYKSSNEQNITSLKEKVFQPLPHQVMKWAHQVSILLPTYQPLLL